MSIDNSVNGLLEGGGKSAKFPTAGTTVKGTVVSATTRQATEFGTGKPKTFDNGDPMMELVVTLQTTDRDPDDQNDDGRRTLYAGAKMLKAIKAALQAAGAKLEEGGTLAVQYTGDGEPSQRGFQPPKLYVAQYEKPAAVSAGVANLL